MAFRTASYTINRAANGARFGAIVVFACLVSGCVASTLSQQDTQPEPIAETKPPSYDPAQRDQAIAEIRQKAAQPTSGELTNAYAAPDGPGAPLTPEEQAALTRELEQDAETNNAAVTDAEMAEQQRSIRELQSQARSHYKDAVNKIEN